MTFIMNECDECHVGLPEQCRKLCRFSNMASLGWSEVVGLEIC
jgi:hypothetical protein